MQELRALQEETTRAVRPVLQEGDQVRQEAREALRSIAAEVREAQERPTGVSLTESPQASPLPEIPESSDDFAG